MIVRWAAKARQDVRRIVQFISQDNPVAGRRIGRELILAGDSLSMFPYRGRLGIAPDTRELVSVWPYVIVYEVGHDHVQVLRIWHGAQDRR